MSKLRFTNGHDHQMIISGLDARASEGSLSAWERDGKLFLNTGEWCSGFTPKALGKLIEALQEAKLVLEGCGQRPPYVNKRHEAAMRRLHLNESERS